MIWQINKFNSECIRDMESGKFNDYTLEQYMLEKMYSKDFIFKYLIPMSSAIWSTEIDVSMQFPFITLVRFFQNHGMLGLNAQHQWYTVVNGSETYKKKLIEPVKNKILLNKQVIKIVRKDKGVEIITQDQEEYKFDKVVIAAHANEALEMLENPNQLETKLLSAFSYQKNIATLHTDSNIMPAKRKVWSAWNYRIEEKHKVLKASTIYYMNQLQRVSGNKDYFVSINHNGSVKEQNVLREFTYYHPIFSLKSIAAQENLHLLNEQGPLYFCGSYFKYGFHEDALTSGIEASKKVIYHNQQEIHV